MKFKSTAVLFFVLLIRLSFAAPETSPKETFRLLTLTPNPILGLYYDIDGKPNPINAFTGDISKAFKLPPKEALQFYRLETVTTPDGPKQIKKIVAEVTSLSKPSPVLVILSQATPGQSLTYNVTTISISAENQPADTVRFFNYSSWQIANRIFDETFVLKPGELKPVNYGKTASAVGAATLDFAIYKNNDWEPIGQSLAYTPKGSRGLVFYFNALDSNGRITGVSCNIIKDGNPPLIDQSGVNLTQR